MSVKGAILHVSLMGSLILAAVATAGAPQTQPQRGEQVIQLGRYEIRNIGMWTPDTRKDDRPDELWKYYMHGVVDHFATPVAWDELFGPDQDTGNYLTDDQPIDVPYKKSNLPALRIDCTGKVPFDGQSPTDMDPVQARWIDFARPIPIAMDRVRGNVVRLFVWLKGDDVGSRTNCWHGASMYVTVKDAEGSVLAAHDAYIQTLRTFPWHCYYTDQFIPKEAAGVYLRLYNKFNGVAYFSMLSWEIVHDGNRYTNDEKQDPHTGSLAFNPIYDEMPYHLKYGFGSRYKWRFVLGDKIGLAGQPYDITTKEGFRKYYFEEAKTEPEHMNHAILYMQSLYRNGSYHKMLPPMEEGWLENFAKILMEDQDKETGYWHDGISLSLGLTFHLVDMHFRYYDIPRRDREDQIYRGKDLVRYIPRPREIILTTLRQQSSYVDEKGVPRKAAWNWPAYRLTTQPDQYKEKCYLGTTWDAINLIRRAARYVDNELQAQVYDSVKAAFRYVLHRCVLEDGTFKQRDTDPHPTDASYMERIIQDSSWLERRIVPDVPAPKVTVKRTQDGAFTFEWTAPTGEQNAVRIYVVPKDTKVDAINESHLRGVIHRTGHKIYEMDPFLAVQKIRQATVDRWGGSMELPPPDDWRGRAYLPWKLRMISYPLAHSEDSKPLAMTIAEGDQKTIYLAAATWYGEESPPVAIAIP